MARPISKLSVTIPKIIGTVIAIPISTAFEKLVLLKYSINSIQ